MATSHKSFLSDIVPVYAVCCKNVYIIIPKAAKENNIENDLILFFCNEAINKVKNNEK
jgi:hypothetical protein